MIIDFSNIFIKILLIVIGLGFIYLAYRYIVWFIDWYKNKSPYDYITSEMLFVVLLIVVIIPLYIFSTVYEHTYNSTSTSTNTNSNFIQNI